MAKVTNDTKEALALIEDVKAIMDEMKEAKKEVGEVKDGRKD